MPQERSSLKSILSGKVFLDFIFDIILERLALVKISIVSILYVTALYIMSGKLVERKPTVVDLFCGAGGMSEGFKMAGYRILLGIEQDEAAGKTYRANNPDTALIVGDIQLVADKEILERLGGKKIDVVIGGPPCQGFSMANTHKKADDPRNELYLEFVRVVKLVKPDFFVMENVSGFLNVKIDNRSIVEELKSLLEEYEVEGRVLTAADYGVPQVRRRAVIIGRRGTGEMPFPKATYFRKGVTEEGKRGRRWKTVKALLIPRERADDKLFYSKKLIKGFRRRERANKKAGVGFKWQFLDPNKPSYTIPARYYKDGANALVKYSDKTIRKLDFKECARIQSFPRNYIFVGSKVQIYKQIGNAVPPLLSYSIAKNINKNNGIYAGRFEW